MKNQLFLEDSVLWQRVIVRRTHLTHWVDAGDVLFTEDLDGVGLSSGDLEGIIHGFVVRGLH
jgi:hypothetical protein